MRHLPDHPSALPRAIHTKANKGHDRTETRTSLVSEGIAWLRQGHAWPGLAAASKVTRTREVTLETCTETARYLLGAPVRRERRQHWVIENGRHWGLDVMNEDWVRAVPEHEADSALSTAAARSRPRHPG